jgi:hypothetical protein
MKRSLVEQKLRPGGVSKGDFEIKAGRFLERRLKRNVLSGVGLRNKTVKYLIDRRRVVKIYERGCDNSIKCPPAEF